MPTSTERGWADALGWNHVRVRRFIAALERQRLVSVTRTKYGTRLKFLPVASNRSKTVARPLHARSKTVAPRLAGERDILDQGATLDAFATSLIEVMNDELTRLHPDWYRPVLTDNKSSQAAGGRIRQAGVPLERAIEVLRLDCRKYNPSRHGRGEPPYSLAYFEKGILDRWRAEQTTLPLLAVERPVKRGDRRAKAKPEPIADVLDKAVGFDWRAELKRKGR
jgi:hypothetical protein